VDPRAGLENVEKRKFLTLPELELQPLGHPARIQSLYQLRYPGIRTELNLAGCDGLALWLESGDKECLQNFFCELSWGMLICMTDQEMDR
jgi:hypothetical protein